MVAKGKEGRAILVHVMKTYGKQAAHLHLFLMSAFTTDGGGGELHTLATLTFGKQAPLSNEWEVSWPKRHSRYFEDKLYASCRY